MKKLINDIRTKYHIQDDRSVRVISIDPPGWDIDDAFSYEEYQRVHQQNVNCDYIANVLWLDYLDLWSSFSTRVATIYLPNKKRPMMPTLLSDVLCSLQEKQERLAFVLELIFDKDTMEVEEHRFYNAIVKVERNHAYDTDEMKSENMYVKLFTLLRK